MRPVSYVILLAVFGFIANAACVDSPRERAGKAPVGSPVPYTGKEDEYIAERTALLGGRGDRVSGTLRLRLANGQTFQLVDKIEDGGEYRRYVYDRWVSEASLHVVTLHLYEGGGYVVVHGGVASEAWLTGPPVVSPDGRRFVTISSELDDFYSPNRLEIWQIDKTGLVREFAIDGEHAWGPEKATWVDAATVQFVRVRIDRAGSQDERVPVRLLKRGDHWTLQRAAE